MIKQLRKASEHLYTRIFIGLIVIAFVLWGISDFKNNYTSTDVVVFKYLPNIGLEEFSLRKRENLIKSYNQNSSNTQNSKEEDNKITYLTLNQLINERLIEKLIKDYELDISEGTFIEYVKQIKAFQNENGVFDKTLFEKILVSSNLSSEEFIDSYKKSLLQNLIFNIYISSTYVPDILKENILNYMLDTRIFDLAYIDLAATNYIKIPKPTEKVVTDFYLKNQQLFEVPESRKVNYIVISYEKILKEPQINDIDISNYYKENESDFSGQTLEQNSEQIKSILESNIASNEINEFTKSLEDEIASGKTLEQVSKAHELKIVSIEDFTNNYQAKETYLNDFKETILNMQEKELSYPIDIKDGLIIFEIDKIKNAQVPDIKNIYEKVEAEWKKDVCKYMNLQVLQDFANIANSENFVSRASDIGLNIDNNIAITRDEHNANKNVPDLLLNQIFVHNIGEVTEIIEDSNKAYIAIIRNISKKQIDKSSEGKIKDNIENTLKRSTIEELLYQLREINQIKINMKSLEKEDQDI